MLACCTKVLCLNEGACFVERRVVRGLVGTGGAKEVDDVLDIRGLLSCIVCRVSWRAAEQQQERGSRTMAQGQILKVWAGREGA